MSEFKIMSIKIFQWTSMAVQWLGFCASTEGVMGLIPGQGTKILHVMQPVRENFKNKNFSK